jgi:transposase-like protein
MKKASASVLPLAAAPVSFKGYRFPPDIISYAVWLYYRFPLSCAWSRRCWPHGAANNELGLNAEHRQHKGLNNWAENSNQPTRMREKLMRRFQIGAPASTIRLGS